jgi:hypothetical protein
MHFLYSICEWLEQTGVGSTVRDSTWLFPIIETIHILGIAALVGSTSILDLRLMGLTYREQPVSKVAWRFLPWAWVGFLVQVITGGFLFASEATKMITNLGFQVKMILIVMAGINALVFHLIAYQSVGKWENDRVAPLSARIAGFLSIALWFGIVGFGRWIAYV